MSHACLDYSKWIQWEIDRPETNCSQDSCAYRNIHLYAQKASLKRKVTFQDFSGASYWLFFLLFHATLLFTLLKSFSYYVSMRLMSITPTIKLFIKLLFCHTQQHHKSRKDGFKADIILKTYFKKRKWGSKLLLDSGLDLFRMAK